jgi:hypothetical protein
MTETDALCPSFAWLNPKQVQKARHDPEAERLVLLLGGGVIIADAQGI